MNRRKAPPPATRECYVILESEQDENGYIPSLVRENESGYFPMVGKDELATPWYWGKTKKRAIEVCKRYNQQHFGISQTTADRIIASSMNAANTE